MDKKLYVDTLILIPTFRINVFSYYRRMDGLTDRQTDRQTEKLIWCGLGNLIGSSRLIGSYGNMLCLGCCVHYSYSLLKKSTHSYLPYLLTS
jgi:hypothetical protein